MAMVSTIRTAGSVASAAAPYAQRLMEDADLRSSIGQLVHSANDLYDRVSGDGGLRRLATDDNVRQDVDRIVESLQSSARSVARDTRRRTDRRALVIGVGLGVLASGLVVAALYPRIRRSILSTAGDARERISATVDDARGKVASSTDELRERASRTARNVRGKVSEGADGARKQASEVLDDASQKLSKGAEEAGTSVSDAVDEVRRAS